MRHAKIQRDPVSRLIGDFGLRLGQRFAIVALVIIQHDLVRQPLRRLDRHGQPQQPLIRRHVMIQRRKALGTAFGIGGKGTLTRNPKVGKIQFRLEPKRLPRATATIFGDRNQTAIRRIGLPKTGAVGPRGLHLHKAAVPNHIAQIRPAGRLICHIGLFDHARHAEPQTIRDPAFHPPTIGKTIHIGRRRRVFIGNHKPRFRARPRRRRDGAPPNRPRQRCCQRDHTLQIIDAVIAPFHQSALFDDAAGIGIAHLDHQGFGAHADVRLLQEIDRPARAQKHLARGQLIRLCGIGRDRAARIPAAGLCRCAIDALKAIQCAFIAQIFTAAQFALIVAP